MHHHYHHDHCYCHLHDYQYNDKLQSLSFPQILDEHSNPASEPGSAAKKSRALFTEVSNEDSEDVDDDNGWGLS